MARHDGKVTLAGDKWDMGWGAMSLGWAGWGVERAHGICMPSPLFCFPARKKLEMAFVS